MESTLNCNASLVAVDWTLARSDMRVRAALIAEIEAYRLSCEEAATAAGVGSNTVRTWKHRQKQQIHPRRAINRIEDRQQAKALSEFEAEELDSMAGLAKHIGKKIKVAESGKDAQGWTAALATVLDLRRRAAGKPSTLVKGSSAASNVSRPAIVFIPTPTAQESAPLRSLPANPKTYELEHSTSRPPSLIAAVERVPEWQRAL